MTTPPAHPERWKNLVVILTVATTVLAATAAGLQVDATIRAGQANNDSQLYAVKIMGELERSGLEVNYEVSTLATVVREMTEEIKLGLASVEQTGKNDALADQLLLQSQAAEARALRLQSLSVLYGDARYAPTSRDGLPNWQAYMADSSAAAQELLAQQNAATDVYHQWSRKSDSYVVVLTILAVALFLFGLAQALTPRLRLLFALFGIVAASLATLQMVVVLVS